MSLVKSHDTYLTFNYLLSSFVSSSASQGQPFWTIGNLFRASKCFLNIKLNVWNVSNFVPIIKYLFPLLDNELYTDVEVDLTIPLPEEGLEERGDTSKLLK